jgi:hypothetical protein
MKASSKLSDRNKGYSRFASFWTLVGLCLLPPSASIAEEARAATLTAQQVIDGVISQYEEIVRLPGLRVEYHLEYKAAIPNSSETYAWPWADVVNLIRPGDIRKRFLRFRYPEKDNNDKPAIRIQESGSDGEVYGGQDWYDNIPGTKAGLLPAEHRGANDLHYYYFAFLGFPFSDPPEHNLAPRRVHPEGAYWLPEALRRNRSAYRLMPQQEKVDGEWCHLLERDGMDRMWVQTKPRIMLKQREFRWGMNQPVRSVATFAEFEPVSNLVSLPKRVFFDEFAAPWDNPAIKGRLVGRFDLKIGRLEVAEIPIDEFRIKIAAGTLVADQVQSDKGYYFVNRPGQDPFETALVGLRAGKYSGHVWYIIGGAAVLLTLPLAWYYWRWKKKPRTD